MKVKKFNMADRAKRAAQTSPSLEDRLAHSQALLSAHPINEAGAIAAAPANAPSLPIDRHNEGMDIRSVALELIDTNPYNARRIYRTERVNKLAASIGANGQEVPGIATMRDGRYVLAAGHYRLRAIKALGLKTMFLRIHENLSDRELYEYSYRENAEREAQSPLDNAMSWRDLLTRKVYDNETELADATGMSLPNVNKTLAILKLTDPVLEIVMEEPTAFALSALYELTLFQNMADEPQTMVLAMRIRDGDAGRKEVQEARAQLEKSTDRKRKETSRQYHIKLDGAVGALKEWDSGKVVLEIRLDDPKAKADLVAELRNRFGISD
jgi:ParB family chromosome partitioning protein